jgi:hypothetical protein
MVDSALDKRSLGLPTSSCLARPTSSASCSAASGASRWRFLEPGERACALAALLHVDGHGTPVVSAMMEREVAGLCCAGRPPGYASFSRLAHQARFPELAQRFALFDLLAPRFTGICLNPNRLLLDGYADRPERLHAATHGSVRNPLAEVAEVAEAAEATSATGVAPVA